MFPRPIYSHLSSGMSSAYLVPPQTQNGVPQKRPISVYFLSAKDKLIISSAHYAQQTPNCQIMSGTAHGPSFFDVASEHRPGYPTTAIFGTSFWELCWGLSAGLWRRSALCLLSPVGSRHATVLPGRSWARRQESMRSWKVGGERQWGMGHVRLVPSYLLLPCCLLCSCSCEGQIALAAVSDAISRSM